VETGTDSETCFESYCTEEARRPIYAAYGRPATAKSEAAGFFMKFFAAKSNAKSRKSRRDSVPASETLLINLWRLDQELDSGQNHRRRRKGG